MAGYRSIWGAGGKVAEYNGDELVFVDREYFSRKRSDLAAPTIIKDIGEYRSPIDGQMITSRSAHRDHLKAHDVIELGNEVVKPLPEVDTSRDIGMAIKRRIEEVKALPESTYREHVQKQQAECAQVASLITAG